MELVIDVVGDIRCIYSEDVDLTKLGKATIQRASHVEPTTDGGWTADMAPMGGPVLGPFQHRSAALEAEVFWLSNRLLQNPSGVVAQAS